VRQDDRVRAVRSAVGSFALPSRGVLRVSGGDAERWLNGMLSNDVAALSGDPARSGCYATILTPQGRIVADPHVLWRPEGYWLELPRDAIANVITQLDRYIIADDVRLEDVSPSVSRLGIEGPRALALLGELGAAAAELAALGPDCSTEIAVEGARVVVAAYGWTGEPAYQLFVPAEASSAAEAAVAKACGELGGVAADEATLDVLRVEAGVPRLGAELDEEVLPDEARLGRTISETKGCYTGPEIVARLRSQGRVSHLLVGLRIEEGPLPEPDTELRIEAKRVGEVTSSVHSPHAGAIALGFVRRAHAEPGTELLLPEGRARVAALPIVSPGAGGDPRADRPAR